MAGFLALITSIFLLGFPSVCLAQTKAPKEIVKEYGRAVVLIRTVSLQDEQIGLGSGFIVDSRGVVVTNYHVIKGAIIGTALLLDSSVREILGVIAVDPLRDIAVVKVTGENLPTVRLGNSDTVEVMEDVVAIGNPKGIENIPSKGIISSVQKIADDFKMLGFDASISHGSSGGPLFNSRGEVIGITTLSVEGGQNLNFAVPINYVKPLLSSKEVKMTLSALALELQIPEPPSRSSPPPTSEPEIPPQTPPRPIEPAPSVSGATAGELYKRALRDYTEGNYELAIKGFETYIARYPNTSLIPNAYYWLGEANYIAKYYASAIKAFDVVFKQYPGSPKVASALLKQGYAYLELGETERARVVLSEVITRFPKSQEAKWAKERLNIGGSPSSSPPAPVETGMTVGKTDPALANYIVLVQKKIDSNWVAPRSAPGTAGTAVLSVRVARSGQVRDLMIHSSSGDRAFDDAALRAVRLSSPLPPLPPLYKAETLILELQFDFEGIKL